FFYKNISLGCSSFAEGLDVAVQAALVTSGLVLVDDAFVGHTVDYRHGCNVSSTSFFQIFCIQGLDHILDVGADHGAQAGVVAATLLSLNCAFFGGRAVGHRRTPRKRGITKQIRPRIMPMWRRLVKLVWIV